MLNESIFSLSLDGLKTTVLHDLTIFDVALAYVLMYVVYKALGRYIYFKPQEHTSKINRTFLTLSLLVVALHLLTSFTTNLPFLPNYQWLYAMCSLVILIAPLSILMYRVMWKYSGGRKERRDWHYNYLPIPSEYYKTSISKSERDGNTFSTWEEEGVESTSKNIHSDALLNVLALIVFLIFGAKWAYESIPNYGAYSFVFFVIIALSIGTVFLDRGVFSWIMYLEEYKTRRKG